MKGLLGLIAVLAVAGLALAFTKPTEADFEAALETQLLDRIDRAEPDMQSNPASAVLLATCKLGRTQCAELIRSMISLDYRDKVLFAVADVSLGGREGGVCYGAATRIFCRETGNGAANGR
ncbi:hypothetical protein DSD19_19080 [Rhodovulum sp. BSW8]|uniref:DUF4359 domain-containing protein n=1 Tax=Rhodovulum visakhapatnamense TaxID=364297 RepID=A0A4V3GU82_9RHOB|nr:MULTISPECIES: hypothetical protein [Rhodovulum]OLS45877.1 hypothetical protein BV509_16960 [Rhodovulum sulfidophilum]MBL3569414.1 hypothetical protein [Rhodovulum visakhapatnamense]MBL3578365.1 hypothetical protein [Rhodovulum visakhapatnamense]RBO51578.1 hypothetical protein DSD19_19080 [Rhodovulum sp. BSW8]TDX29638.1 hypothetical protein EV657_10857 [Rhodovulum visakhapatnamense]